MGSGFVVRSEADRNGSEASWLRGIECERLVKATPAGTSSSSSNGDDGQFSGQEMLSLIGLVLDAAWRRHLILRCENGRSAKRPSRR